MRKPSVVERCDPLQIRKVSQRQKSLQSFVVALPRRSGLVARSRPGKILASAQVGSDIEPDPVQPRTIEHAARIEEIARRRKRHRRNHRLQVRRVFHCREPLHRSRIGKSERPYVPIRPLLARSPFDRVVAVAPFVLIRRKLTVRGVPSPHVLNDDRVTSRRRFFEGFIFLARELFAVRRAVNEYGMAARAAGQHHVAAKDGAIAHGDGRVVFEALFRCRAFVPPGIETKPQNAREQQHTCKKIRSSHHLRRLPAWSVYSESGIVLEASAKRWLTPLDGSSTILAPWQTNYRARSWPYWEQESSAGFCCARI